MNDEHEPIFLGLITDEEIESFKKSVGQKKHPLKTLLAAYEGYLESLKRGPADLRTIVMLNTARAVKAIDLRFDPWLQNLKKRILDVSDPTNASSAFGEIRALGSVVHMRLRTDVVTPQTQQGGRPEFVLHHGDQKVVIEVHTKQSDPRETERMERELREQKEENLKKARPITTANGRQVTVTTAATIVSPLGAPTSGKAGDFYITNEISRIASIKQRGHQVVEGVPFVLWLDFQEPDVWLFPQQEHYCQPIFGGEHGRVKSGFIWWALYGEKDDSIVHFENYTRLTPMAHPGKFAQDKRISAIVVSLSNTTLVFEHPDPSVRMPAWLRHRLFLLPQIEMDNSWLELAPGMVSNAVQAAKKRVALLGQLAADLENHV